MKHSVQAQNDIIACAGHRGYTAFNQEEIERCNKFKDKYGVTGW